MFSLEKIKGFRGDEYIVCSTINAVLCADFAVMALQRVGEYLFNFISSVSSLTKVIYAKKWSEKEGYKENSIELRIAISQSTVFGGMVGSEKLTYDYWGEGTTFTYA